MHASSMHASSMPTGAPSLSPQHSITSTRQFTSDFTLLLHCLLPPVSCLTAAALPAAGAYVARLRFDLSGPAAPGELGCGPLRLWPGGLHMSRAIGDTDCGQLVIPHPYIQQVQQTHSLRCMLCPSLLLRWLHERQLSDVFIMHRQRCLTCGLSAGTLRHAW
jgi:hypothetical protein